jgi:hypothetical protein
MRIALPEATGAPSSAKIGQLSLGRENTRVDSVKNRENDPMGVESAHPPTYLCRGACMHNRDLLWTSSDYQPRVQTVCIEFTPYGKFESGVERLLTQFGDKFFSKRRGRLDGDRCCRKMHRGIITVNQSDSQGNPICMRRIYSKWNLIGRKWLHVNGLDLWH